MKATEVTAGLAECIDSLLPGLWHDSLHVTCGLTACTPESALGPTLGNEYGKTLPFYPLLGRHLGPTGQVPLTIFESQQIPKLYFGNSTNWKLKVE